MTENDKNPGSSGLKKIYNLTAGRRIWLIAVGLLAMIVVLMILLASNKSGASAPAGTLSTFKARKDDLTITVTESGSIKARNSIDLKSEVEGRATIINIVPEGSYITTEDVNKGKVLVELDSGDLKEQLSQREIDFTTAEASYAQAKEAYDIQVKQNESDISAAELKVKFALMDFQKYLGETLANRLIEIVAEANDPNADIGTVINVNSLLDDPNSLGGEASQRLGELHDNILLAEEQLKEAQNKLDWTIRLREKQYVSETELQTDRLSVESLEIKYGQAKTNLNLFNVYDFSKQTQKLLSDYYESKRNLDRTYAKARSQLAQARAQLESAKSRLDLQQDRLDKSKKQFAACTMKAPGPGLVVYGSSLNPWRRYSNEGLIAAGEQVYQRQTIISLPDTSEMMAEITVHESSVDKVKPGQKATIVMDAFPDQVLHGEVIKIAPLPDQQRGWLSPDVKVYTTNVGIEGTHDFLKPGMSARVEILVEQLPDVLIVPVQVVANRGGRKICFIVKGGRTEEREVTTGLFNDTYVQIADGLQAGDDVLLNPPRITDTKQEPRRQVADKSRKSQPQTPASPGEAQAEPIVAQAKQGRPLMTDPNFAGPPGMTPVDFNQLDDQTKERMKQFREKMQRGEISLDPNQMDEQARERFRKFRNRSREQSDGAATRQAP
ncbi:MAG: efflux RND transporter periplasmic adaptor subunit [Sedimentisphaerales bacterium]|nr:efflux RND transporter periplasmic adaptor subunit [Sedimentisphaerales bacterium]